jgi:hypothetical protein
MSLKSLLKNVQIFEKIAVYNNRSTYLYKLAQEAEENPQQRMMRNELDPSYYPEINEIVERVSTPRFYDSFDADALLPYSMQLQAANKAPMDLDKVNQIVSAMLNKLSPQDGNFYQLVLSLHSKLSPKTNSPVKPTPTKIDSTPRYYPVASSTFPEVSNLLQSANKLISDWNNPLNLPNRSNLQSQVNALIQSLNKQFATLSAKADSIESIPSRSPEDQEKDKKELQEIHVNQTKILTTLNQLSNLSSSGRSTVNSPR